MEDEGLETVAEMMRVFIAEEEGGRGGGAALSVRLSLRKLMERCRDDKEVSMKLYQALFVILILTDRTPVMVENM